VEVIAAWRWKTFLTRSIVVLGVLQDSDALLVDGNIEVNDKIEILVSKSEKNQRANVDRGR
jgi:hypothetical protein